MKLSNLTQLVWKDQFQLLAYKIVNVKSANSLKEVLKIKIMQ